MSAELQFIFTFSLYFACNLSNHLLSLPHIASVKWDSLGFLLFVYKQIVTVGRVLPSLLLHLCTLQRKIVGVRMRIECLSEGEPGFAACRCIHLSAYNE